MFFIRNITILVSFLLIIILFSSCRKLDKEGPATATVSIKVNHSRSSSRMDGISRSFTTDVDTELIALVTENTTFNQQYLSLENRYQFALTDLSTDTVTLTVPLDTGIKLYSYAYFGDDFTLSELENTVTQADEFGETSSFTISTDDTSKEVSLKYFYRQMGGSIQGTELSLSTVVTTLAGDNDTNNVSTDETGVDASFSQIYTGITTDGTNLYVAEYGSNKIRKIVIDNGTVTTLAGTGTSVSTDGTGTAASFARPMGITTDGTNLYVVEYTGHKVRKIVISTGVVTTLAGSGTITVSGVSSDGTGTAASFNYPWGITTDGTNLYVAEYGSNKIRKIVIDNGTVTTLAGTGTSVSTDGTGTAASFAGPMGITTDGTNLYIVDYNGHKIRKLVISTGVVTTLAGSSNGFADHDNGTLAKFYNPRGITTDGTNLYVGDTSNRRIRQIVIDNGTVTTLAGSGSSSSTNGKGTAASFSSPEGITNDGNNLYVVDRTRSLIRKIE
jgi:hypothetical protein